MLVDAIFIAEQPLDQIVVVQTACLKSCAEMFIKAIGHLMFDLMSKPDQEPKVVCCTFVDRCVSADRKLTHLEGLC